jgi:phage-related baseplate assembly protein
MTRSGTTPDGFVPRDLIDILTDTAQRARAAFGDDADLSPTSALAKILQVTADEDALLWRGLQDVYYSQFVSTATGADLDLLGDDIGISRRALAATGQVTMRLSGAQPGRAHVVPAGTVLVTGDGPAVAVLTTAEARLSELTPSATVPARAAETGPAGNLPAGAIVGVDPDYARDHLDILPPAALTVTNQAPFDGGQLRESDVDFRARQLGFPREMWTVGSVRAAALAVPGVLDVLLAGPLGGLDVSRTEFNLFLFGQRPFAAERPVGEPCYVDLVVAHDPLLPWRTTGPVTGIHEQVHAAVEAVRPLGVFLAIREAETVRAGVRATVIADPGLDPHTVRSGLLDRLAADLAALRLGGDVLFSHVMRVLVDQPGVADVQDMRLRRSPAGGGGPVEAAAGENLTLAPAEVAVFAVDSELFDIEVVRR